MVRLSGASLCRPSARSPIASTLDFQKFSDIMPAVNLFKYNIVFNFTGYLSAKNIEKLELCSALLEVNFDNDRCSKKER